MLSRWPQRLIKQAKMLKKRNEISLMRNMRSTIILSGIAESLPKNMTMETINHEEAPHLSRHVRKHFNTFANSHLWQDDAIWNGSRKYLTLNVKEANLSKSTFTEQQLQQSSRQAAVN